MILRAVVAVLAVRRFAESRGRKLGKSRVSVSNGCTICLLVEQVKTGTTARDQIEFARGRTRELLPERAKSLCHARDFYPEKIL